MTDHFPVKIIDDAPVKAASLFGFDAYSQTLVELIANPKNRTPLVIGIYGPWGTGKTTLMESVKSGLNHLHAGSTALFRRCKPVWFQAWKYGTEDEILAALLETILKAMQADDFFTQCREQIEKLVLTLKPFKAFSAFAEKITKVDVTEFFQTLPHKEKLGFYDTFSDFFQRLIWTYLNWRPQINRSEKPDDTKAVLVIFIDDLDRCPKERIPKVLETIKLFMDWQGCVFVIGADHTIVEAALRPVYGEGAAKFMEKIVQVTFNLPQIRQTDFNGYLDQISPEMKDDIAPYLETIIPALDGNPRRVKRFLNNLSLQQGLMQNRGVPVKPRHLLYWNIIDYVYPALREDLKDNPAVLESILSAIDKIRNNLPDGRWEISDDVMEKHKVPDSLRPYLKQPALIDLFGKFTVDRKTLETLITFSTVVESAEETQAKIEAATSGMLKLDKMVEIPAGDFLYGDNKEKRAIENPFMIDVYPVTNEQYDAFIRAGGYDNDKELWGENGLKWKQNETIDKPEYWGNDKFNRPEQPVVGVSFYEARAYARWAKKDLPTEQQWERAARGTDGREYPWGDKFDREKANTEESGIGRTTRVTRYPNGISPDGCYDMAGNVWEWTCSNYHFGNRLEDFTFDSAINEELDKISGDGTLKRLIDISSRLDNDKSSPLLTIRGGFWGIDRDFARCADRGGRLLPYERGSGIGFRCVRTVK